jgi:MoaA/NifB/PqqE/SkfB family radical SAM enzyme
MHVSWIVADLMIGSGGHRNILRAAHFLEKFGHTCELYFLKADCSASELKDRITQYFYPGKFGVHIYDGDIRPTDFVLATHWSTVDAALNVGRRASTEVIYFVQDYEPLFSEMGSEYVLAENSYRLGLHCICLGPWCAEILRDKFGVEADHFQFPIDHGNYHPFVARKEIRGHVLFFAKPRMTRRCYELGLTALTELHRLHPEVRIGFFGYDDVDVKSLPFPIVQHGLVTDVGDLARLYRSYHLGLVFSPTNPSSVGYEMMACGLPIVDLDRPGAKANYGGHDDLVLLADSIPKVMAEQIAALLTSPKLLASRRERSHLFARQFPGDESSVRQIEGLLEKRLRPRRSSNWLGMRANAMIDVTSFCNLRCVYCYQSKPDYQGEHADDAVIAKLPEELDAIGIENVTLAGEGEVTVYKEWPTLAAALGERNIRYALLTNLSYAYSDEQIGHLARASELTVSFDTYDSDLHAEIRRRSSLSQILTNIRKIRECAASLGRQPRITQNCVVSDRNIGCLERIVRNARQHGIDRIAFLYLIMNLVDSATLPMTSLENLASSDRRDALRRVREAVELANTSGVEIVLSDYLRTMLDEEQAAAERVRADAAAEQARTEAVAEQAPSAVNSPASDEGSPPVQTRLCVHPWNGLFVTHKGKVGPCCLLPDAAGDLTKESLSSIVAGPKFEAMRAALLAGDLEKSTVPEVARACARCNIYPHGTTSELRKLAEELGVLMPDR